MSAEGLLCHIDDENRMLTVFNTTKQETYIIPNIYYGLMVGEFYTFKGETVKVDKSLRARCHVEFEVVDGEVEGETDITCLTKKLCKDERIADKVYSPQLGPLSDPKGLLTYYFDLGKPLKVLIRFSQNYTYPFEVIQILDHSLELRLQAEEGARKAAEKEAKARAAAEAKATAKAKAQAAAKAKAEARARIRAEAEAEAAAEPEEAAPVAKKADKVNRSTRSGK